MENPNFDKVSKINEKAQKLPTQGSVVALTREKLVIALAMFSFAIILLTVVLVVTFGGGKGDNNGGVGGDIGGEIGDNNGGTDDDNTTEEHKHE